VEQTLDFDPGVRLEPVPYLYIEVTFERLAPAPKERIGVVEAAGDRQAAGFRSGPE
jgi:hypothetical protein